MLLVLSRMSLISAQCVTRNVAGTALLLLCPRPAAYMYIPVTVVSRGDHCRQQHAWLVFTAMAVCGVWLWCDSELAAVRRESASQRDRETDAYPRKRGSWLSFACVVAVQETVVLGLRMARCRCWYRKVGIVVVTCRPHRGRFTAGLLLFDVEQASKAVHGQRRRVGGAG
jgi:hypothetical protein